MRHDFRNPAEYRPRLNLHRVAEAIMAVVIGLILMVEILP